MSDAPEEQQLLARQIGTAIRAARKRAGLTLVQLAQQAGLSQPFLSQAENGQAMTSVLALHRIAQALGTTAHALLEPPADVVATSLVHAEEARTYRLSEGAELRFCVTGDRAMDLNEVRAGPRSAAEHGTVHVGEELVHVISGSIRFVVGADTFHLRQGDTLYYSSTRPHQWFNDAEESARFLIASTPPGF